MASSDPTAPALTQCDRCKLESEWAEAFHQSQKPDGLWNRRIFLCPRCWDRKQEREQRQAFWGFLGLGFLGLALGTILPSGDIHWSLLNVAMFFLWWYVLVIPHEAGHALTAWMLRDRVYGITIGWFGRTLKTFRFARFWLELRSIPAGGLTWWASPSLTFARLKNALVYLGGPIANVLLIVAALNWVPESNPLDWSRQRIHLHPFMELEWTDQFPFVGAEIGVKRLPGVIFVMANMALVLASLFPHRFSAQGMSLDSDGLGVFRSLFGSEDYIRQGHAQYFFMEAISCASQREYDQAINWCERGLEQHPGNESIRGLLGPILFYSGQVSKARAHWQELLADCKDIGYRLTLMGNIAGADLLVGSQETIAEAATFSVECMRMAPWQRSYQITNACVLICLGQVEEGKSRLEQILKEKPGSDSPTWIRCFLAVAEAKQGRWEEAKSYLADARKCDPHSVIVETIGQKMAKAETPGESALA